MDSSLLINQCENGAIGLNMLKQKSDSNYKIIVLLDICQLLMAGDFLDQIEKNNFYIHPPFHLHCFFIN
jgi:hypothetical protein